MKMPLNQKKALTTTLLLLLLFTIITSQTAWAQDASITAADTAINQAFTATLDAEKTGQDITSLLNQLNNASELLANAQNAFRSGNKAQIVSDTNQAIQIANTVKTQAAELKSEGIAKSQNTLIETAAFSLIGITLLSIALFYGWRFFKKSYIKRMLTWKPEVNTDET
jgi:hypothetical protein